MSSSTDTGGRRRPVSCKLEDNSNKKKQKDKANQESKEAKQETNRDPKKDPFIGWKQNASEIIVKLRPGERCVKVEDVNTSFTDQSCLVKFADGCQWSCHLNEDIESSCSKVQYKEKGNILQLVMQKKIPFHTWPFLMKKSKESDPVLLGSDEAINASKLEHLLSEENSAEQPEMESKKGKVDRGSKRTIKQKPAGKSETGSKVLTLKTPGSTELQVEPSGKRVICPKDQDCNSRREPLTENVESTKTKDISDALNQSGKTKVKIESTENSEAKQEKDTSKSTTTIKHKTELINEVKERPVPSSHDASLQGASSDAIPPPRSDVFTTRDTSLPLPVDIDMVAFNSVRRQVVKDLNFKNSCLEEECIKNTNLVAKDTLPNVLSKDLLAHLENEPEKGDKAKEDKMNDLSEVSSSCQTLALEPMVNLTFVKNDFYEKGNDVMVVSIYLKEICRETAEVFFREQDFTLIFQTSDPNFLRLHPDCGPDTKFKWQVKLRNLINPDKCTHSFTPSRLDIFLKKRHSQRWGGLEAPTGQGAVGGAKVAVPTGPASLEKSSPGSSQHTLPSKEEPRTGEKEKTRAEEGSLDSVSARTLTEHVPLKQEPALVTSQLKPTCMVQPMTHAPANNDCMDDEEEKKVCLPGFTGLVNLGNTCFMNSVIQSLSNTRELRDYFHDRAFESEINCSNPLGTGGRLAIGFAVLLRALWKGTHHAFQPSKLKAIVASKASQFTGYAQHDAQEFMAFLLDGLHEDLNRIQSKPYTETVDSDGRPDEVVAEEAWRRHKMRNDSFIVDLFQGQYKSKLVCPICAKVSITFDPFLYLPVPLPQKQKVLTVFFFWKDPHKKPVKFLVSVSKENSCTTDILESISRSVKVKPENLRLTEASESRFHRVFLPSNSLDAVSPTDTLFCFEVQSKELAKEKVVILQVQQRTQVPNCPINKCAACQKIPHSEDEKIKRCTRCYRVGYCNQNCQKNHWQDHKNHCRPNTESIGFPFLISVPESRLTYSRLAQLLEGYSRYSVNVFQPPFQSGRMSPEMSQCRMEQPRLHAVVSESHNKESYLPTDEINERGKFNCVDSNIDSMAAGDCKKNAISVSTLTLDSGYSDSISELQDHLEHEKEITCEKTLKPEAVVTGYQQPTDIGANGASQFYICLIDASNKEQKLEDKGDKALDIPEGSSVILVWKNNERQKEYVLVKPKELEYIEDLGSASENARAGHFTLEQCLKLFTKPEVLAPEEAWYCPKCKQHREASKQLMLWRLPNVLIIQLKRFSFRNFIWRDKINDMVDFPVRNLDLSKFCIGQKDDSQPPIYDLYAVINHYGGMIGGHYTAYARLPSDKNSQRSDVGWRLFDDSTVTTVEESQVVTRYAYVLFYRRRNSPVERPIRRHSPHGTESPSMAAGAAASQASLIWQELEEDEDADVIQQHMYKRFWTRTERLTPKDTPELVLSSLPDAEENCVRFIVLGTIAAVVALFVNVLYPLMSHGHWK
ncbi:ubiquitin carboxyl-terminal hydrolase 19 isoform X2 [Polypterus senegalus]|uniref:ubiquitin carboxyl-terminal hydrolase 19 isoform X2 n=1 Tax=Polypterus senegalus TaxID=55291 RepID=UPI0019624E48|nr:ubiquitin carboxyl-terminal hydrolase 19 isoform X2 [Polypterus senegalus]